MVADKEVPFFLIDQILEKISALEREPVDQGENFLPGAKILIKVSQEHLEPVWRKTLKHLETLPSEGDNSRIAISINKWKALGIAVRISALTNPLIGCSWYKCPLYEEQTERKMMLCIKCEKAQYCNRVCQRK